MLEKGALNVHSANTQTQLFLILFVFFFAIIINQFLSFCVQNHFFLHSTINILFSTYIFGVFCVFFFKFKLLSIYVWVVVVVLCVLCGLTSKFICDYNAALKMPNTYAN